MSEMRLDAPGAGATLPVMLQHNTPSAGQRAHVAHAALIGLHALCCGMPVVAVAATALAGATSGLALFSESVGVFHHLLHAHEIWIALLSAVLVCAGGAMEFSARRDKRSRLGFPWLFALSLACFLANLIILAVHRG